jgi:hypothetical protein
LDICQVTCTHTDDGDGQVVKDVAFIAVSAASGAGALDPDENTANTYSINESSAISGWLAADASFRGPVDATAATLTGADAASFSVSGGSDGSIEIRASTALTFEGGSGAGGEYEFAVNVDNEGGGGYTTSTFQVSITPDSGNLVMAGTSDGYIVYRDAGGTWNTYLALASSDIFGVALTDIIVNPSVSTEIGVITRWNSSSVTDSFYSATPRSASWGGGANQGSARIAAAMIDSINERAYLGGTNRTYWKTVSQIVTSGNMSNVGGQDEDQGWNGSPEGHWDFYYDSGTNRVFAMGQGIGSGGANQPTLAYATNPAGTWTDVSAQFSSLAAGDPNSRAHKMASDGSTFVVVGPRSGPAGFAAFSTNGGATWDVSTSISGFYPWGVACNDDGSLWVAVGTGGAIYTSTDPTTGVWTSRTSGTANDLYSVVFDNTTGTNEFIAVGANLTMLSSTDGTNWSAESVPSGPGAGASFRRITAANFTTP